MALRDIEPESVDAIVISHEHTDHIKGAGIFSRRFKRPIYINEKTFAAGRDIIGTPHDVRFIDCGTPFFINSMKIHPFSTSHDAADPAGFSVEGNGVKLGVATDLGIANLVVREHLKHSNVLIVEANHDPVMLFENDNYPWPLKQRVKGRKGHLANEETFDLLIDLVHDRLYHVILAHLSEENNTPEKAMESATKALNGSPTALSVAAQHDPGRIFRIAAHGLID
jgi:phosphoribosyl 1,2-cyclic phosphodiesterase